jgi:methoxymalonate biosynthesis acyl carrier protein
MTQEEIVKSLSDILREKIIEEPPPNDIEPDVNVFTKGYISSLQLLDLVVCLEKAFSIAIPHYDVSPENFETLNRLAKYIGGRIGNK